MNAKRHRWVVSFITCTILITISVQVYWNYKNYEQNKLRVLNEIQASLNDAIETYFSEIAKPAFLNLSSEIQSSGNAGSFSSNFSFKERFPPIKNLSLKSKDSIPELIRFLNNPKEITDISISTNDKLKDSVGLLNNLKAIYISIRNDKIDFQKLDSLLKLNLKNKNLSVNYQLLHIIDNSMGANSKTQSKGLSNIQHTYPKKTSSLPEKISSKLDHDQNQESKTFSLGPVWNDVNSNTTFLKNGEQLKLRYIDSSFEALKRGSLGILLSLILSLAIIASLIYLLYTINKQKALAAIKNDLISNITHEFKTPITTVSTALEAIKNFNALNDKEKTKKYLDISTFQLNKLHLMVEKLLETATLDSEHLLLNKTNIDLVQLIKTTLSKNEFAQIKKTITFKHIVKELWVSIDSFHLENAISNLVDNAIKYGGKNIDIQLLKLQDAIEINITDDGIGIEKSQQDKIFDKFYRIPKGNTHDVKGFGIGLYYTKTIIEKHGGEIHLMPHKDKTIFKISLAI